MRSILTSGLLLSFLLLPGCGSSADSILADDDETGSSSDESSDDSGNGTDEEIDRLNPDWTDESHSNDVAPDYQVVFPEERLLRLDITIAEENWAAMQEDVAALLGSTGGPGGMGGPGGQPVEATTSDEDPMWSEATIQFEGMEWQHVGIRYKGNSSLQNAYSSGGDKYPFKLDFDEWEDDYPSVDDQRFFGFKQLNLGSNYDDQSSMREKVAADLFRSFGVPSAHTSFCEVYLDRGEGPTFIGLYTLVEEVDDTVLEDQFTDPDGNLFKPDGTGASFAAGTYNEAEMELKTNEDAADYSDVKALYDALHADSRTSDVESFQAGLEAVFDVDSYLRYLAVNQVIQNWDTYGVMTHNFYLYNDGGRFVWIPWDNNEAFSDGKMGGALSLSLDEVSDQWPFIRYVLDVPAYESLYQEYVAEFSADVFSSEKMSALYDTHAAVISEPASNETPQFENAVSTLKSHVEQRTSAVQAYLP